MPTYTFVSRSKNWAHSFAGRCLQKSQLHHWGCRQSTQPPRACPPLPVGIKLTGILELTVWYLWSIYTLIRGVETSPATTPVLGSHSAFPPPPPTLKWQKPTWFCLILLSSEAAVLRSSRWGTSVILSLWWPLFFPPGPPLNLPTPSGSHLPSAHLPAFLASFLNAPVM